MRTATVRDLRNRYSDLMAWLEAGEEIGITRRGKLIARLVPESEERGRKVDWTKSEAYRWDRSGEKILTAEESATVLEDSKGPW
jgi:antitoxin (DNA-binding transcriptional repressor) of toxin-antitoxin stability system